jgi:hypothetical protein
LGELGYFTRTRVKIAGKAQILPPLLNEEGLNLQPLTANRWLQWADERNDHVDRTTGTSGFAMLSLSVPGV